MSEIRAPVPPANVATAPEPAGDRRLSYLALVAGAVAIGFAPIFVRGSEVGPVSTGLWRVVLAVPFLWIIAALAPRDRPVLASDGLRPRTAFPAGHSAGWWMMLVAGLFFAGDLAVWHWSIRFTSVANSTMLANFAPVFVVLYAWLAHRHRVTRRFLLAMLVALAGMGLLIGRDFRLDPRALFGDLLGLATAVFYAGYLLSMKQLRGRFPTAIIMARTALFTALALLPVAAVAGETFWPRTPHAWAMVGGLALCSHVGGQTLIAYALAKLPAPVVSVTLMLQPVTATIAAATLLGEPVTGLLQVLGMLLVFAGVFVARQDA